MIAHKCPFQPGIIVSCQARPGSPLKDLEILAALAAAAEKGGAVAIRADGPIEIGAIRRHVRIPIIGLYKQSIAGRTVITPDLEAARTVVEAGADVVAFDATTRLSEESLLNLVTYIQEKLAHPAMADISTYAEGVRAAQAGVCLVSTTLSGYTDSNRCASDFDPPDLELLKRLATTVSTPVVAEGRFWERDQIRQARRLGAYAVVIGKAITAADFITRYFTAAFSDI